MEEISYLSRGSYGVIYAVDKNTVIKQPIAPTETTHPSLNEVDILRQVSLHPGFVHLTDVSATSIPLPPVKLKSGEILCNLYLSLERASINLDKYIETNGAMGVDDVRELAFQLFEALHYLHGKGFLHLDIHPMNVLIFEKGRYTFCDLGMGAPLGKNIRPESEISIHPYNSPERIICDNLSEKSDIWSLGCVLFFALTDEYVIGRYLPAENGHSSRNRMIRHIDYTLKNIVNKEITDPDLRDLLLKILQVDPNSRPSVIDILQHRFFKGRKIKTLPILEVDNVVLSPLPRVILDRLTELYEKFRWKKWFSCRGLFMGLDIFNRLPDDDRNVYALDVCFYIALNYILTSTQPPEFSTICSRRNVATSRKIQEYVSMNIIPLHRRHLEFVFDSHGIEITPLIFYKIYFQVVLLSQPTTYEEIYRTVISS